MTFDQSVASISQKFTFARHPYREWILGMPWTLPVSKQSFLNSQKPFIHAVEAFPCALSAVVSKMPRYQQRIAIVENVWEEHGHGLASKSNIATFAQYLKALGSTESDPGEIDLPSHVLLFNETIRNYCLANPPEAGAALLGMIEYQYIEISHLIANLIIERSWVVPGEQNHYATHEELDQQHAEELFEYPKNLWESSQHRAKIIEGMMVGAHSFWSLYRDMVPYGS